MYTIPWHGERTHSDTKKIKTTNFFLKGFQAIPRKLAPAKITRYTVCYDKLCMLYNLIKDYQALITPWL